MSENIEGYGLESGAKPDHKKLKRWFFGLLYISVIFAGFSIVSTQQVAALFGYHEALGDKILFGLYKPWQWAVWFAQYNQEYSHHIWPIIKKNLNISLLVFAICTALLYLATQKTKKEHKTLHGSAHFANFADIKRIGLDKNEGIVLGAFIKTKSKRKIILRHNGPEHVLMVAPTGSGKGVSVVNPTLLSWPHSMVVYDLKKENWAISSRWRKEYAKNTVLRFEPACNDGTAASYNPLSEIRLHTDYDVQDTQNIATIVLDHDPDSTSGDRYFTDAAFGLMVAYLLHTCYKQFQEGKPPASLCDVAETLSDPNLDIDGLLLSMKEYQHLGSTPHPVVMRQASSLINMMKTGAGRQFAGIQGVVESKLGLYADPIVRKNITESDFSIYDLMNRDNPVTLYICVGSTDKSRLKPLTKLLITQIIRNLTKEVEYKGGEATPTYKHKLLMLIDEFPSLGKMTIFNEAIAFLRGYGIRCLLIIQDFNQLRSQEAYGREEAITSNCGIRIAFAPNTVPTAEELSKMVGQTTVEKKETKESHKRSLLQQRESPSIEYVKRELLTPDEIMRMPTVRVERGKPVPGQQLILIAGQPPIWGEQILHFQDPVFKERLKLGSLERSDVLVSIRPQKPRMPTPPAPLPSETM